MSTLERPSWRSASRAAASAADVDNAAPVPDNRRFARSPGASGHRLVASFQALEAFPALGHVRDRLVALLSVAELDLVAIVETIESDAALTIALLRAAAKGGDSRTRPASVPAGVSALTREQLQALAAGVPVFGFFEETEPIRARAEQYRLHAVATQLVAEQVRRASPAGGADELAVAALLHDIGRVPLLSAYDRYEELMRLPGTPEQRIALERRYLGIDHAMTGGVLARRLGLNDRLAGVIERHHAPDAAGDAAIVRLADMLVHYSAGRPADKPAMREAARSLALSEADLSSLLSRLPGLAQARVPRLEPSPLSTRQTQVLRLMAEGKLYAEIGAEMGLAVSTIRTHVHAAYTALRVPDRAQAVIRATERGWL